MSEYIIEYKKGVVFGTRFDENWTPKTMYASTIEEVNAFKGSKYVQSIIANNTFKQIKEYLISGRYVMYIATPCQIAGLISYLNKDYDKLITVDLICHGVCPPSYFKAELNYLKQTHSFKDLTDIRFRYNGRYTFRLTLWNKRKYFISLICILNITHVAILWALLCVRTVILVAMHVRREYLILLLVILLD